MAFNKNHQAKLDLMAAYEKAPGSSTMVNGMPRTAAQQASVKKAAKASALARAGRAEEPMLARSPTAPVSPGPAALSPGTQKKKPGLDTGGLSLNSKKGLLSL